MLSNEPGQRPLVGPGDPSPYAEAFIEYIGYPVDISFVADFISTSLRTLSFRPWHCHNLSREGGQVIALVEPTDSKTTPTSICMVRDPFPASCSVINIPVLSTWVYQTPKITRTANASRALPVSTVTHISPAHERLSSSMVHHNPTIFRSVHSGIIVSVDTSTEKPPELVSSSRTVSRRADGYPYVISLSGSEFLKSEGPLVLMPPLDDVIVESLYRDLVDIDRSITALFSKMSVFIPACTVDASYGASQSNPIDATADATALVKVPANITLVDQFRRIYTELEALRTSARLEQPHCAIQLRKALVPVGDSALPARFSRVQIF